MQFDVIIGNPPYHLGSDGGTRDVPIYQHFVEQAKKLEPRYLSMVIPSRWMAAGLGLGEFRQAMLGDRRMRTLVDYPAASDVFPGVAVKAGVCYFLWDAKHDDDCSVTSCSWLPRDSTLVSVRHQIKAKKLFTNRCRNHKISFFDWMRNERKGHY